MWCILQKNPIIFWHVTYIYSQTVKARIETAGGWQHSILYYTAVHYCSTLLKSRHVHVRLHAYDHGHIRRSLSWPHGCVPCLHVCYETYIAVRLDIPIIEHNVLLNPWFSVKFDGIWPTPFHIKCFYYVAHHWITITFAPHFFYKFEKRDLCGSRITSCITPWSMIYNQNITVLRLFLARDITLCDVPI